MKFISFSSEARSGFTDLVTAWERAEFVLKTAEMISNGVVLPSVFELRYSGRRMIDVLRVELNESSENTDSNSYYSIHHLRDAIRTTNRATHDAIDASVGATRDAVYAALSSSHPTPEINEDLRFLSHVENIIAASRADRSKRDEAYDYLVVEALPKIVMIHRRYKIAAALSHKANFVRILGLNVHLYLLVTAIVVAAAGAVTWLYLWLSQ